ncbi:MAG: transposase [Candidatus Paracaedibacter sp.]
MLNLAKYRFAVFYENIGEVPKEVCMKIENLYQVKFLGISADEDPMHLLVHSVTIYNILK